MINFAVDVDWKLFETGCLARTLGQDIKYLYMQRKADLNG
jgi:hypothetical protein